MGGGAGGWGVGGADALDLAADLYGRVGNAGVRRADRARARAEELRGVNSVG